MFNQFSSAVLAPLQQLQVMHFTPLQACGRDILGSMPQLCDVRLSVRFKDVREFIESLPSRLTSLMIDVVDTSWACVEGALANKLHSMPGL